jgi:hypothetical protein
MFGKSKISKSMIDAVNSIIGEEPVVENKTPAMLSENKPQVSPERAKGDLLQHKDDVKASKGKSAIAMSAEEVKPEDARFIDAVSKVINGERNVQIGESTTFKDRLLEKSTSEKQARTMAAAAHNPSFAKKVGIPQDVAKDFNQADKGTKQLSNAMKKEDTEIQEGLKDIAKRVLSKVGGGSDKDQLKRLQKNMGVPQTGEKPKNEEVEELDEKKGHGESDPLANRASYAKRHGTGQVYKKTYPGNKTGMTQAYAYDITRSGPKGKLPEDVESVEENAFTDYKTDKKPSIFAAKSHAAKKTSTGTVYTKNWSKKDQEHKDEKKTKNEAVDNKESEKHVRIDGETDMNTKTVDTLRGRVKVPADYHNKTKSYKVGLTVGEEVVNEAHPDEKEDKELIHKEVPKIVKKDALKKTDEAFKGPEAGSGVGDHPFVTSEAKPLKNARALAKTTMGRLKNEMLGKLAN